MKIRVSLGAVTHTHTHTHTQVICLTKEESIKTWNIYVILLRAKLYKYGMSYFCAIVGGHDCTREELRMKSEEYKIWGANFDVGAGPVSARKKINKKEKKPCQNKIKVSL